MSAVISTGSSAKKVFPITERLFLKKFKTIDEQIAPFLHGHGAFLFIC